jgi:uncharacterized protein
VTTAHRCDEIASHPDLGQFWQWIQQGELRFQCCLECGTPRFYPRLYCPRCGSAKWQYQLDAGTGTVYSATTVRLPVPQFEREPPYQVALADLDSGVRFLAAVAAETTVAIGDRIVVAFRTTQHGIIPELAPGAGLRAVGHKGASLWPILAAWTRHPRRRTAT